MRTQTPKLILNGVEYIRPVSMQNHKIIHFIQTHPLKGAKGMTIIGKNILPI